MRALFRKLYSSFTYRLRLREKLLVSYFLLIILPLVLFIVLSSTQVSKSLIAQSRFSANSSLEQTGLYMDRILSDITNSTDILAFNTSISEILTNSNHSSLTPAAYADYLAATQIVDSMFNSRDLYSLEIFVDPGIFYASPASSGIRGTSFSSLNSPFAQEVQSKLERFNGKIMWLPARPLNNTLTKNVHMVLTGARFMKRSEDFANIGILTINILQSDLNTIVNRANSFRDSLSFLIDSAGNIISASDNERLQKYPADLREVADRASGQWEQMAIGSENVLVGSYKLDYADWRLVSVLPYSAMLETSTDARNKMLIIMLLIGAIAYFASYFVARTITGKISALIARMREVQFGNFSTITLVKGNDEMGALAKNYNYMLEKINEYAQMQYELGREVKHADLKALQAQINPHFLYNTLDLVNLIALENGNKEIPKIIKLLSNFYKLSLNNGDDIVTVEHEIAHIETFVKLQNFRFSEAILLHIHVDPAIMACPMPKLLLQPIVENSILHGILEKPSKTGEITITGCMKDNILHFSIADDGVGMSDEQLASLINQVANDVGAGGYGLRNINTRIQLNYGTEYGLRFERSVNNGMITRIEIPIDQEQ